MSHSIVPTSTAAAHASLAPLLDLSPTALTQLPPAQFDAAWAAIAYLLPGLHPDEASHHGSDVTPGRPEIAQALGLDPRLAGPNFLQSGWPVVLAPVASEAARRFEAGVMSEAAFWPVEAQRAGIGLV